MISIDTAQRLRDAGVRWEPTAGDRFTITEPRMDDEIFVVSDMTIDVHRFASGTVLGFNGTTEWALDSIAHDRALWLPRETQLRGLLGKTFRRFEPAGDGWRVDVVVVDRPVSVVDADAEQAYARALLVLITGEDEPSTGEYEPSSGAGGPVTAADELSTDHDESSTGQDEPAR